MGDDDDPALDFETTSDEPTTLLAFCASHGNASRFSRIDWLPRCVDLTDPVGPVSCLAYSPKSAKPHMAEVGKLQYSPFGHCAPMSPPHVLPLGGGGVPPHSPLLATSVPARAA